MAIPCRAGHGSRGSLIPRADKVTSDRRLATTHRLEVDRGCESHGGGTSTPSAVIVSARYAHLVHAAVTLP